MGALLVWSSSWDRPRSRDGCAPVAVARGGHLRRVEQHPFGGARPVGAENPVTSRDLHILVDESAEPVASQRPDDRSGGRRRTARGRALIQRSVRTVGVVMPDVLA